MNILLISGSPRKGNTDYILNRIFDSITIEKEIIFLRDKEIKHCSGCLSCDKTNNCIIQDDMQETYEKLRNADLLVIGTPNYFDNVTGLLKDFMDRTNPFYETDIMKGKKIINIVVGGGKIENSKRVTDQALKYFRKCHNLELVGDYWFVALNPNDLMNDSGVKDKVDEIVKKVNFK